MIRVGKVLFYIFLELNQPENLQKRKIYQSFRKILRHLVVFHLASHPKRYWNTLLLTYVCLKRLFNGDLYDSPNDATEELFYLSQVLRDNRIYSDVDVCIVSFIDNVNVRKQLQVDALCTCTEDLVQILSSKEQFIARILSDLHSFIKKFYKYIKTEDAKLSEKLYKTSKKVYFLMSYSIAYEHEVKSVLSEVLSVKSRLKMEKEMYMSTRDQIEKDLEKLKPKPKLIEEL